MIVEIDHPSCGPLKLINSPVKYSRTQPTIRSPPPLLGEHTAEILDQLGFDESEIEEMKSSGVVA
jgi:succinate--hydroxymethylglutarate CoA-transferase